MLSGDTRSIKYLKVIDDQGWAAFRKSRDDAYRGAADQTIVGKDAGD